MWHSESIAELAPALVAAQGELKAIAKDSKNPHFNSKFASLDTIVETVRPVLAKNGLAVSQGATAHEDAKVLVVETTLIHTSGEWFGNTVVVPLAKVDPQGAGGALTYGRRYGLAALLSLATEEDDDGNVASRPQRAERKPPTQTKPALAESSTANVQNTQKRDEDKTWRGRRLADIPGKELEEIVRQHRGQANYDTLVKACTNVLTNRALGLDEERGKKVLAASGATGNDGLPF